MLLLIIIVLVWMYNIYNDIVFQKITVRMHLLNRGDNRENIFLYNGNSTWSAHERIFTGKMYERILQRFAHLHMNV